MRKAMLKTPEGVLIDSGTCQVVDVITCDVCKDHSVESRRCSMGSNPSRVAGFGHPEPHGEQPHLQMPEMQVRHE